MEKVKIVSMAEMKAGVSIQSADIKYPKELIVDVHELTIKDILPNDPMEIRLKEYGVFRYWVVMCYEVRVDDISQWKDLNLSFRCDFSDDGSEYVIRNKCEVMLYGQKKLGKAYELRKFIHQVIRDERERKMERKLTLQEMVQQMVTYDVISEQVATCMLEANAGTCYGNILTNANEEPTEFLQNLMGLLNLRVERDGDVENENRYRVKAMG